MVIEGVHDVAPRGLTRRSINHASFVPLVWWLAPCSTLCCAYGHAWYAYHVGATKLALCASAYAAARAAFIPAGGPGGVARSGSIWPGVYSMSNLRWHPLPQVWLLVLYV